jgi:hypothetical protein
MAAGIDGHATVREVRLGSIGTRRKKAPKGVPSDAEARLHTLARQVRRIAANIAKLPDGAQTRGR